MNKDKKSLILMNMVPELTPKVITSLLDVFGTPYEALKVLEKGLCDGVALSPKIVPAVRKIINSDEVDKEIKLAEDNGIKIISYDEKDYVPQLKNLSDFPYIIYLKGKIEKNDDVAVAVVGSRMPTNYGRTVTRKFSKYFAENRITVISGLARGVDAEAHTAAIENGGRTIAVIGNGMLEYYPPENRKLQEEIYKKGAVISEFPLKRFPDRLNFPRRNRIVAEMSAATVVTEAAAKSGAIITAELAAESGKDVFAVPGPVYSKYSEGPNRLIKNGASVALSPEDVIHGVLYLEQWVGSIKNNRQKQPELFAGTDNIKNKDSIKIFKMIKSSVNGVAVDEISAAFSIPVSDLSAMLLDLELSGLIKSMPGQIYICNN